MEATKKVTGKSVKKWLGNNAIIVLMLAVSLIVGIIHPNFFALANIINLFKNVSIRYIIALGISGCLITTGNDLSAGRLAGFAACLACIFAQTEGAAGKFYPNMPTLPTPVVFILGKSNTSDCTSFLKGGGSPTKEKGLSRETPAFF